MESTKFSAKKQTGEWAVEDGEWAVEDEAGFPYLHFTTKKAASSAARDMSKGKYPRNCRGDEFRGSTDHMEAFEEVA